METLRTHTERQTYRRQLEERMRHSQHLRAQLQIDAQNTPHDELDSLLKRTDETADDSLRRALLEVRQLDAQLELRARAPPRERPSFKPQQTRAGETIELWPALRMSEVESARAEGLLALPSAASTSPSWIARGNQQLSDIEGRLTRLQRVGEAT